MPPETHLQELVAARLGCDLTKYVSSRRAQEIGWRTIAADIRRDSNMVVSYETLRSWFATSDAA